MARGRGLVLACALSLAAPSVAAASEPAALSDIVAAAQSAQIVILGEVHDNPGHHARQAEIIAMIDPAAVVFEMISADAAARITPDLARDPAALALALDWANSGWPDAVPIWGSSSVARGRAS